MTPKERILTALARGKPDKTPVAPYFWGAEYRWKVVGVEIWELLYGDREMSFVGNDRLQEKQPCDWINVHGFGSGWLKDKTVEKLDNRVFITDADGIKYEFLNDGHQLVRIDKPQTPNTGIVSRDIKTKADVDEYWGRPRKPREKTKIEIAQDDWQKRLIDKYGETILMTAGGVSPFVQACYALGFETSLIMMKENPDVFVYMMDRFYEDSLPHYEHIAAYGYEAILIAESWASVDIISPQQYYDFAFPYQKKAIQEAQVQGLKAILYSTGYVLPILPKMCELGADALSIEEGRKGQPMDIVKVREIVGPDQCIFGNFDAETVLLRGTKEDIKGEVKRQIDSAGKDGAFIMGTGSPVCDDTPIENLNYLIQYTHEYNI